MSAPSLEVPVPGGQVREREALARGDLEHEQVEHPVACSKRLPMGWIVGTRSPRPRYTEAGTNSTWSAADGVASSGTPVTTTVVAPVGRTCENT
jgi:hypothetical protein